MSRAESRNDSKRGLALALILLLVGGWVFSRSIGGGPTESGDNDLGSFSIPDDLDPGAEQDADAPHRVRADLLARWGSYDPAAGAPGNPFQPCPIVVLEPAAPGGVGLVAAGRDGLRGSLTTEPGGEASGSRERGASQPGSQPTRHGSDQASPGPTSPGATPPPAGSVRLSLVFRVDERARAVINGRTLEPGDLVREPVRVLAIHADGVEVRDDDTDAVWFYDFQSDWPRGYEPPARDESEAGDAPVDADADLVPEPLVLPDDDEELDAALRQALQRRLQQSGARPLRPLRTDSGPTGTTEPGQGPPR